MTIEAAAGEFQKGRARDEVFNFVLQNCLAHRLGDERPTGYGAAFNPIGFLGKMLQPGDLILLSGTGKKAWALCWLHRVSSDEPENRYLCESIETGEMCWWSNVGIEYLDRDVVASHPQWKWNDEQFVFNDRWREICGELADRRELKPLAPEFGPAHVVTLSLQSTEGWREERVRREFADYRKVTGTEMRAFFTHGLCEMEKT